MCACVLAWHRCLMASTASSLVGQVAAETRPAGGSVPSLAPEPEGDPRLLLFPPGYFGGAAWARVAQALPRVAQVRACCRVWAQ